MAFIEGLNVAFALAIAVEAYRRTLPPPAHASLVVVVATALLTMWIASSVLLRIPSYEGPLAPAGPWPRLLPH